MSFWQRTHEGYLFVDHRASPGLVKHRHFPWGLSEEACIRMGYDPMLVREGKVFEAATMMCCHCGGHVVKNLWRRRDRTWCQKCDGGYVCDPCTIAMRDPNYVHRSWFEKMDQVQSGRFTLHGASMSTAILIPTFAA